MTCEAKTETDKGNVFDGIFENDEDPAMGTRIIGVCCPPEVSPVVVELRRS